VDDGVTARI